MRNDFLSLSFSDLFRRLSSMLRSFTQNIEEVVNLHEQEVPEEKIRELMNHIKERATTDAKEADENKAILSMLKQLVEDKQIFSLIKIESSEWIELLDALEKRLEEHKGMYDAEEMKLYKEIKNTSNELKALVRKME
ncbi:MAG: hypothetical protein ACP5MK_02475 [Candidatus Micrarchaeia archaeon]